MHTMVNITSAGVYNGPGRGPEPIMMFDAAKFFKSLERFITIKFPYLMSAMVHTDHESDYHGEGTVWAHTEMVAGAFCSAHRYPSNVLSLLPYPINLCYLHAESFQMVMPLALAAFLHDVGKTVTKNKDEKGKVTFYNHSFAGTVIALDILYALADQGHWLELEGINMLWSTDEMKLWLKSVFVHDIIPLTAYLINNHMTPRTPSNDHNISEALDKLVKMEYTTPMLGYLVAALTSLDKLGRQPQEQNPIALLNMWDNLGAAAFASRYTAIKDPDKPVPVRKLHILTGLPGSGKSSYVKEYFAEAKPVLNIKDYIAAGSYNSVVISFDNIVTQIATENGITYNEAFAKPEMLEKAEAKLNEIKLTAHTISDGPLEVIIDMTNLTPKTRRSWTSAFPDYSIVYHVFLVGKQEIERRLLQREKDTGKMIPADRLMKMICNYQLPLAEDRNKQIDPNAKILAHLYTN